MNKKLNEKYLNMMKPLEDSDDAESAHYAADNILCALLEELGYTELVESFYNIDRWYA